MSAVPAVAPVQDSAPSLVTLARVELRKMVDTRAGRWLLGAIGVLVALTTTVYVLAAPADELTFAQIYRVANLPISVLLPVLGILSITSEWSQRTALTTFTLVPSRHRVVAAKLLAVASLAVAAVLVALLAGVLGNLPGRGDGSWSFGLATVGETLVYQLLGLIGGFAFGLLLQSSAPAIVLFYVLPTIWGIATSVVGALDDAAPWLELGQASAPLVDGGASAKDWAQIGTASALWVLLPLVAGLLRLPRSEVK